MNDLFQNAEFLIWKFLGCTILYIPVDLFFEFCCASTSRHTECLRRSQIVKLSLCGFVIDTDINERHCGT